jgi:hypothetical protein
MDTKDDTFVLQGLVPEESSKDQGGRGLQGPQGGLAEGLQSLTTFFQQKSRPTYGASNRGTTAPPAYRRPGTTRGATVGS